jgi:hypothetical protein
LLSLVVEGGSAPELVISPKNRNWLCEDSEATDDLRDFLHCFFDILWLFTDVRIKVLLEAELIDFKLVLRIEHLFTYEKHCLLLRVKRNRSDTFRSDAHQMIVAHKLPGTGR